MSVNPTVFTPEPITTTPQVYVDGEDLIITTENSNEVVKLSDRVATTTESIKQGYKRVRQDAVLNTAYFQANTTYEFIYHHDLDDETITFPTGVILNFNGGKLDNGTLVGNHTAIVAPITLIFKKDLKIDKDGTWNIDRAYSDWFECYKNGYYIDPKTFVEDYTDPEAPVKTYEYNNVVYNAGDLCGATYNNDRHILQQLLNLSANHTIISEGIYMVDAIASSSTGASLENQLTWFKKKGLTLQIDGILKLIPNNTENYCMLMITECDNLTLCGAGKLVGDLPEHQGTTGEWGMCLQVCSTTNMQLLNLTFEQGWGDGVYYSWRYYWSDTDPQNQAKHYWNNVKCLYNRRTGFVVEKGDYLDINLSEFNYNGTFRGTSTFSGVDIEPFGWDNTPKRYCKEIHFNTCTANYNNNGTGFRFERVVGGSIKNCEASSNQIGIALHQCYVGNEDKVWGVHVVESDRFFIKNRIVIDSNTLKDNYGGTITADYAASSAVITNNFIQNTGCIIGGHWQDTIVENNTVMNTRYVFALANIIDNFRFEGNYVEGIDAPDSGSESGDSTAMFSIRLWGSAYDKLKDVLVKNNRFKYAGGKKIYGSNDSQPLPYPSVKNYLFMHAFPETNTVKYIDNHFDDELWGPFGTDNSKLCVYGNLGVQQERNFTASDLQTVKHLLIGDKIHMYGQTGVVTTCGWFDVVGTEFDDNGGLGGMPIQKNQIIYNSDRTAMFVATNDGVAGPSYPVGWAPTGTVYPDPISVVPPTIEWKGVGTCNAGDRPTEYNTAGRTLMEFDASTGTSQMIRWNETTSGWDVI
jgi:hypothetical protein